MSVGYGYGTVNERSFISFEDDLAAGEWKKVDVTGHFPLGAKGAAALLQAPSLIGCKARLLHSIKAVAAAFETGSLSDLDVRWDTGQRRLSNQIAVAEDDPDPSVQAAARRLRAALLSGNGTAQTQLVYDDEVDFGRSQLKLVQPDKPLHADVAKVNLQGILSEIASSTDALAQGMGRTTGGKRNAPSRLLRDASAQCAATFNAVHDQLQWALDNTPPGAERDHLTALLTPMQALLDRRAAPAATASASTSPAAVTPAVKT